jgi:CHAT domain-containing protein
MIMPRRKLSIDLLDDKLVMHVNDWHNGAIAFGNYDLINSCDEIQEDMQQLEWFLTQNMANSIFFKDKVTEIGKKIFEDIINYEKNSQIYSIYQQYAKLPNQQSLSDVSISFMMGRRFFSLPIELMQDQEPTPVATRIPIYKTVVTNSYTRKPELFEQKIKILLIGSNTYLDQGKTVSIGNQPYRLQLYLPEITDLEAPDNEIDEIKKIITRANETNQNKIEVDVLDATESNYESFIEKLANNQYSIIHYCGHGYYHDDKYAGPNSSIFFWRDQDKRDLVGIRREELRDVLRKQNELKLVYLSCCQGAKVDQQHVRSCNFMGLLDAIALGDVPNVIGMRWPIATHHAKSLSRSFYNSLFLGEDRRVETALVNSRAEAFSHEADHSVWCSPVLVKQDL